MRGKLVVSLNLVIVLAGCNAGTQGSPAAVGGGSAVGVAPSDATAPAQLRATTRHGEWVMIPAGPGDSVRAYVVYPERSDRAPVVVAIHDIAGAGPWIRAVADQLAAEGFIAVAPDLVTGKGVPNDSMGEPVSNLAGQAIRMLSGAEVDRRVKAVARWATALPAATTRYGIVGFCWGGETVFAQATRDPDLDAAVVYYGTSPATETLRTISAPVLGLYGGNDARVNATIPPADSAMKAMGKTFETRIYEGAGHGFLKNQMQPGSANHEASLKAWPETVGWFRRYL